MRFLISALALPLLAAAGCQQPTGQQGAETAASPATPPAAPAAALRDTRWVPRQLAGQPVRLPPDTREPYLLLRPDGKAEGNGACNTFQGSFFTEKPGELIFSPLMSTRMACPAMSTEAAFVQALGQARTYEISGDTLVLRDAGAVPVARLEAVPTH